MKNEKVSIKGEVPLSEFLLSLESILEGLQAGAFDMEGVRFAPQGDVEFKLKGKRKKNRESLKLELSWKAPDEEAVPAVRSGDLPARREESAPPMAKTPSAVQVRVASQGVRNSPHGASGSEEKPAEAIPVADLATQGSDVSAEDGPAKQSSVAQAESRISEKKPSATNRERGGARQEAAKGTSGTAPSKGKTDRRGKTGAARRGRTTARDKE